MRVVEIMEFGSQCALEMSLREDRMFTHPKNNFTLKGTNITNIYIVF